MGPKVCDGLDGRWVGRKDGDMGGGVGVQIQLGLEDGGGKGHEVCIESSGCDPNVSGGACNVLVIYPERCCSDSRFEIVLSVPVGFGAPGKDGEVVATGWGGRGLT